MKEGVIRLWGKKTSHKKENWGTQAEKKKKGKRNRYVAGVVVCGMKFGLGKGKRGMSI